MLSRVVPNSVIAERTSGTDQKNGSLSREGDVEGDVDPDHMPKAEGVSAG
jgi:hypothetical protein